MTKEEFIEVLERGRIAYVIVGNKIVVTQFNCYFNIDSLPSGVEFMNRGDVNLDYITSISSGVEFNNGGDVDLSSLPSLPSGVKFNNGGDVNLDSIVGGWFVHWKGNIEGINPPRLLDKMISLGLFDKSK